MQKVSILMPLYNAERWVSTALESALAQTWPNKEIIVVDDGSTDGSLKIAQTFASRIVKVISQSNGGAGVARNRALQEAQGDFIQYLDADDILDPQKIERQIHILNQSIPRMLAVSSTIYFFDGDEPENGVKSDGWPAITTEDTLGWLLALLSPDKGSMVQPGAWLTCREVVDSVGIWDEYPSPDDDGEYFARVVLVSSGIRAVPESIAYYRKHKTNSLSHAKNEALQWGALRSTELKANHIMALTNSQRAKDVLAYQYMRRAVLAYPDYPQVAEKAISQVRKLSGKKYIQPYEGWKGRLFVKIFGWKLAKRAGLIYQNCRT